MDREREAIIIAGGYGTRLAHIVSDVPKPMAPVAGRPFLRFILDELSENGFRRVVLAVGYKRECVERYFGDSYRGMEIVYSVEDSPLLTGGAVKKALGHCRSEWVYVFNGDTFLEVDFDLFDQALSLGKTQNYVFIASKQMRDSDRYGTLKISDLGVVQAFEEKKPGSSGAINAGVYLMRKESLEREPEIFSLEADFFERIAEEGLLHVVPCKGCFIDIGIPADYELAQTLLAPFARKWKLAFFDRDGTINVDTGHLFEPQKLELVPQGIELLRRYSKDPSYKIVVVTNQAGIAKGLYDIEDMRSLHRVLDAKLEALGCRVDAYYFCPHHPDITGYCDCRKPRPGMLRKALFDFEANPSDCVLYGDKTSDIEAAKAAGVRGLMVDWQSEEREWSN